MQERLAVALGSVDHAVPHPKHLEANLRDRRHNLFEVLREFVDRRAEHEAGSARDSCTSLRFSGTRSRGAYARKTRKITTFRAPARSSSCAFRTLAADGSLVKPLPVESASVARSAVTVRPSVRRARRSDDGVPPEAVTTRARDDKRPSTNGRVASTRASAWATPSHTGSAAASASVTAASSAPTTTAARIRRAHERAQP